MIQINSIEELNDIRIDLTEDYVLLRDLDFQDDDSYDNPSNKSTYTTGDGWIPVGNGTDGAFNGTFDGSGYTIKNLYQYVTSSSSITEVGLFGLSEYSITISNLNLIDVNINLETNSTFNGCAALLNYGSDDITISNCNVSGNISNYSVNYGCSFLIGIIDNLYSNNVSITDCTVSGNFVNANTFGGIVGLIVTDISGLISNCQSDVSVSGTVIGGIIGDYNSTTETIVSECNSNIEVNGISSIGGLIGISQPGTSISIYKCFTKGDINFTGNSVGGFMGRIYSGSNIDNCYSMVNINRSSGTSTLCAGFIYRCGGTVTNSYSTGRIRFLNGTDPTNVGFCRTLDVGGSIDNTNFWDIETSFQTTSAGSAIGKTTKELKNINTFLSSNWDISIYHINNNNGYPFLGYEIDNNIYDWLIYYNGNKIRNYQIDDKTILNKNLNIPTSSIIENNSITNKVYVLNTINNNLNNLKQSVTNLNMQSNNATKGQLACDTPINQTPIGSVMVKLNGVLLNTGDNLDCYFSPDGGTTKRNNRYTQLGDLLYWNSDEYDINNEDEFDFIYMII